MLSTWRIQHFVRDLLCFFVVLYRLSLLVLYRITDFYRGRGNKITMLNIGELIECIHYINYVYKQT